MPEKINGQGFRPAEAATARRTERPKHSDAEASGSASKSHAGDTVNLTPSGVLMHRLAEVVQNAPATDAGRVKAAKDAIASGHYEVDHQRVADKMLGFERELLA